MPSLLRLKRLVTGFACEAAFMGVLAAVMFVIAGCPTLASAQEKETAVLLPVKDAAYLVETKADGTVIVNPIRGVTRPGGQPTPNPQPNPNPPPGNTVQAKTQQLTQAAFSAGGSRETAARLAIAYSVVGDQVGAGVIPLASIGPVLKEVNDNMIPPAEREKWIAWRVGTADMLTTRIGTKEGAATALRDVSAGTKLAVEGLALKPGQPAIDWGELLKILLPIILAILAKLLNPM